MSQLRDRKLMAAAIAAILVLGAWLVCFAHLPLRHEMGRSEEA